MIAVRFPGDTLVIKQVQRSIGIDDDGVPRTQTWNRIARLLNIDQKLPINIPYSKIEPSVIEELKSLVQEELGDVDVDGKDGQETWSALAQAFDSSVKNLKPDDSELVIKRKGYTPNKGSGRNERKGVILHHANGHYLGTIDWCMRSESQVSYHAIVSLDGEITEMAEDHHVCWHAGQSAFNGRSNCNNFMLGLAFVGDTNNGSMRGPYGKDLNEKEIIAASLWIKEKIKKYNWTKQDITTHAIVSPRRKVDVSKSAHIQILNAI